MKFYAEAQELNGALAIVTKALSPTAEKEILKGIYMSAVGNELYLKCSDSSIQIETKVPAVIEEDGVVVMPGRITADLMKRMKGKTVDFESVDNTMKVSCGRTSGELQFFDAQDYPSMDDMKGDFKFSIKQNVLRSMIKQTAICCADEKESKAILHGVFIEFTDEGYLNMVALDGFRLAIRTEKVSVSGNRRNVVVHSRTMMDIASILSDTDDEITVTLSQTHISIDLGDTRIKARLLKGEYINYRNILPTAFNSRVTVKRDELLKSVELAALFALDTQNNLLKLEFEPDVLSIKARSETGRINESTDITLTGAPIEIAFNAKYLMDIVRSLDDEYVALSLTSSVTPCVFEPVQGNKFYYLVLPVRLLKGA